MFTLLGVYFQAEIVSKWGCQYNKFPLGSESEVVSNEVSDLDDMLLECFMKGTR